MSREKLYIFMSMWQVKNVKMSGGASVHYINEVWSYTLGGKIGC